MFMAYEIWANIIIITPPDFDSVDLTFSVHARL